MIRGQSHDQVRKILELLPAEQREVIVLRHYADLSFIECIAIIDVSHSYCKTKNPHYCGLFYSKQ